MVASPDTLNSLANFSMLAPLWSDSRWRLLDTGLLPAAPNLALNQALLDSHEAGESPHTLRFLRFQPSALLGFHQSAEQELQLDACARAGITVQRRITGGGAIYFDPSHLGWELYLHRRLLPHADMAQVARQLCELAAQGISTLGVAAQFRPRNDIEVAGRKISGTGGAFSGPSLMYQGTLLLDMDVERMVSVLRIPAEKLRDKAIASARERVTSLRQLLGVIPPLEQVQQALATAFAEGLGIELIPAGLNDAEQARYQQVLAEMDTPKWVYQQQRPLAEAPLRQATHRVTGGLIHASVALDIRQQRLKQVWLTGDFFVYPPRRIWDLEAALKDLLLSELAQRVETFFQQNPTDMVLLTPADLVMAIQLACNFELPSL